jgi:hypothetical protein
MAQYPPQEKRAAGLRRYRHTTAADLPKTPIRQGLSSRFAISGKVAAVPQVVLQQQLMDFSAFARISPRRLLHCGVRYRGARTTQ